MTSLQDVLTEMQTYHSEGIPVQPAVLGIWVSTLSALAQLTPGHYPRPGQVQPLLGIGNTIVYLSPCLMAELTGIERVRVTASHGCPVLRPDPKGYKILRKADENSGMLAAPGMVAKVRQHLGTGTRWLMERDGDCWRGSKIE